ncbi:MAG: site-specific DNA-methyltransferase [bacterium]
MSKVQEKDDNGISRLYHGDNLKILSELKKDREVFGKVRLVYIDPPFGTRQNFTFANGRHSTISRARGGENAYQDMLSGKEYLEFLRPRLSLLKDLLAEDGSIYVHIDCKAGHYVKVLMDEIFGENNFRNDITRIKCNPKNFKRNGYGNVKDMILFYSRGKKPVWNPPTEPFLYEDLVRLFPKIDQEGNRYTTTPLHAPGETRDGPSGKKWKGMKPPPGRHWRYSPDVLSELDENGHIEWSSTGNPRKKKFADEAEAAGKYLQDVWVFKDPAYPSYPTEKNPEMLKVIVKASSNPGDLVLDCFCGSGTALAAANELGRQWIGIDASESAVTACQQKLRP